MKKAVLAVLAVLFLVVLTACGSDKSGKDAATLTKDEKTAVTNLKKAFTESTTGALSTKEAGCVATKFVDTVGLGKLKSSNLLTESNEVNTSSAPKFDADTAGKFADALLGCVDYQKRLAAETAKTDTTVDAAKFESCLEDKLPDSLVKKMLVASQTGSSDSTTLGEQGNKAMTECLAGAKKK
jgi:curli biogenesis system outer membrane secretion channel CsgG